jgi:hypothetical protein
MGPSRAQAVSVDERGFVIADGVKIGKRIVKDGVVKIQLCDKDRRRSAERGTRLVEVTIEELGEALRNDEATGVSGLLAIRSEAETGEP